MIKKIILAILLTVAFPLVSVAQELCKRHVETKGGFSFCPPEGWTIKEDTEQEYQTMVGPRSDEFTPNVGVSELKDFPGSLKDLVSAFTKQSSEEMAKQLGASEVGPLTQSDFITASKQPGIKLAFQSVTNGSRLRSMMYFFTGKGDNRILVTFTTLEKQAEVLDSVFDRSMKTWQLDPKPE